MTHRISVFYIHLYLVQQTTACLLLHEREDVPDMLHTVTEGLTSFLDDCIITFLLVFG